MVTGSKVVYAIPVIGQTFIVTWGKTHIKMNPGKAYAEIALTEPWACVAAYALNYGRHVPGGSLW
jgi:hypothetical protein